MEIEKKEGGGGGGEVTFYLPSSSGSSATSLTKQQLGKQFVIPGEIITSESGYLRFWKTK